MNPARYRRCKGRVSSNMSLWPMVMGRQTNAMRPEPEDLLGIGRETDGSIRRPAEYFSVQK